MGVFAKKKRTPAELAVKLLNSLNSLGGGGGGEKDQEAIAKYLGEMRAIMFGETDAPPDPATQSTLASEVAKSDLLGVLIASLPSLHFETRKDAAAVFNGLMRVEPEDGSAPCPFVEYLERRPELLRTMTTASELAGAEADGQGGGGGDASAALTLGTMLREAVRHERLCAAVLRDAKFEKMFEYMQLPTFEIASDAAASFREILTRHKGAVATFLAEHFDGFFGKFNAMLENGNYVTRRQSLKLLSELLLDRANVGSMMRYIGSVENMCLMMNLLRDEAKSIQFEAFHVFKVFVANPNKPPAVLSILLKNREKMIGYLANFQNDREDEQFVEEKAMLMRLMEQLPQPETNYCVRVPESPTKSSSP